MNPTRLSRRDLLQRSSAATLAVAVGACLPACADATPHAATAAPTDLAVSPAALRALEARRDARIGVWAVNHRTGRTLAWRADERFPFCSAYKGLLAAHILRDCNPSASSLNRVIDYSARELLEGSPVTSAFQGDGLTVRALCAAAIAYSDNTAANLLMKLSGGPAGLQGFLRAIGDAVTNVNRTEPTLNDFAPGDVQDTTTPRAIGNDHSRLLLGAALSAPNRAQLRNWMEGDAVNVSRFRAGLPSDWLIADKTGTGFTEVCNDVGVAWTPGGAALSIAVLTQKRAAGTDPDSEAVAVAARIVARALAPTQT